MATILRGRLDYKRVASYFKRGGLTVLVERIADGEYLLTDKLVMVKCLLDREISLYTDFDQSWECAFFEAGKTPALKGGAPGQQTFWDHTMAAEYHPVVLTHDLHETPGEDRGKQGTMWRKFTHEDAGVVQSAYFNKRILDMISPEDRKSVV